MGEEAFAGCRGTIVIVEDDPVMTRLLELVLADRQLAIHSAGDVPVARELIARVRPELIFLDIGLPGPADGLDLCAELKDGDAASPLVIIMSTRTRLGDIDAALQVHADGYLLKPFSPVQVHGLLDAVEVWLMDPSRPFRHYWPFDRVAPG